MSASGDASIIYPQYYLNSSFNSSSDFYWEVDSHALFGVNSEESMFSLMESFGNSLHYLGVAATSFQNNLDMFLHTSSFFSL